MMLTNLQEDLKAATLARQELKVSVLRLLLSAANYKKIELGRELEDADVVGVIQKEIKQRKESIEAYGATRPDLADKEKAELEILEGYLPKQMGDEELRVIVGNAVSELQAKEMKDMGRVIALVKSKVGTACEGARISQEVKKALSGS